MGLFTDIVEAVVDYILKPFIIMVTALINEINAHIRNAAYQVSLAIARAMENDVVFFFVTLAGMSLIALGPLIIKGITIVVKWFSASTVAAMIKEAVATTAIIEVLMQVEIYNSILRLLWPEYKRLSDMFLKSVSGLATSLGEGTGFVHSALQAAQAFTVSVNVAIGLAPEAGFYQYFEKSTKLLSTMKDDFFGYAKKPETLLGNIIDEVLIPAANDLQTYQADVLSDRADRWQRIKDVEKANKQAIAAFDAFVSNMPNEIEAVFREKWDPVKEWIDTVFLAWDREIVPKVEGIITAFDNYIAHQEVINEQVRINQENALTPLIVYELSPLAVQMQFQDGIIEIIKAKYEEGMNEVKKGTEMFEEGVAKILNKKYKPSKLTPVLSYELHKVTPGRSNYVSPFKTWNVGEF